MLQEVVRAGRPTRSALSGPGVDGRPGFITPVLAGRENLGYLSIIDHPQHLEELAMVAIEHAATVIALEMIKSSARSRKPRTGCAASLVDDLLTRHLRRPGERPAPGATSAL